MFVTNHAALKLEGFLIVADLHIGIEREISMSGIKIPSQTDNMKKELLSLIKKTKPKELVILGDIKHDVPFSHVPERLEIGEFLDQVSKKIKITIVKGNHDSNIETFIDKKKVKIVKGMIIGDYALLHGHMSPVKDMIDKKFIIAHMHPVVRFKDDLNLKTAKKCWLVDEDNGTIIMPPFNPILGGMAINEEGSQLFGPVGREVNLPNSSIYLLDGTHLGRVRDLVI